MAVTRQQTKLMTPQIMSNIPIPDPSLLTTDQLRRELASLRDLLEARLTATERASELFKDTLLRIPTESEKNVKSLKDVQDEKFESIKKQFEERDIRTKATDESTVVAVNTALQAQKEAAHAQQQANMLTFAKLEASITKQIDGLLLVSTGNTKSIDEKFGSVQQGIDHLKDLHTERFSSIQKQFEERDIRSEAAEDAAKVAVNAALQAQKEAAAAQNEGNTAAITKSEAATAKQIDGITLLLAGNTKAVDEKFDGVRLLLASSNKSIDEKIASINGRLDRGEGTTVGKSNNQSSLIAIGGLAVALVVGGFAVFSSHNIQPTPAPQIYNQSH